MDTERRVINPQREGRVRVCEGGRLSMETTGRETKAEILSLLGAAHRNLTR